MPLNRSHWLRAPYKRLIDGLKQIHRTKNQVSVNLNMVETRDSVAETQRQTRVSVSGYITVSHVFRRCVFNGTGTLFYTFPTDFRFRNHVFPQSLTCVYVAETRYSAPETCYFVRSTGGNVKDTVRQPDLFFCVSVCFRYCVNTSKKFHIC